MANRMKAAMGRLSSRMLGRAGSTVTLKRGSTLTTEGVPTVLGMQLLKITKADGSQQTVMTDKDFLIARTAYAFDDVATEPTRGDKIVEVIDGVEATYEIGGYGDEDTFRFADEFRKVYRIHTKRIN